VADLPPEDKPLQEGEDNRRASDSTRPDNWVDSACCSQDGIENYPAPDHRRQPPTRVNNRSSQHQPLARPNDESS
jgi:hypothetical protein